MKILGIIPVRGGSKGIPGKNIKLLGGKPLIAYTKRSIDESSLLSKVVVSTDDDAISKVALDLGLDVPFKRPSSLADDQAPTLGVIIHCLDYFENKGETFDAVCILQVTSPFRRRGMIDEAIHKFSSSGADTLVSVLPVPHEYNPHWIFEENEEGFLFISTGDEALISQRQKLPKAFFRDGAIYLTKSSVIKERHSIFGEKLTYILGDPKFHVNLDTLEDWDEAEKIIKKINNS
ncbi:N-Acetylneuraminate cytidylyltransferase [Indibacter alkaliphilus LW1]|uniref:N-Acetylneuraminate cytidylyltransferase n=1 Tax=Indibacter alkaliphilus (strain CCUG 57479 / KCTC 22604 / LW1) TaxID=1189612 RepID=S2D8X2_INDAL|nr:acylneuraminate cytidylyltransferase family protein [Indibacter alkaliphilus]EOZ95662.1 N-Acetylneuraminate cytidylyltransferase [Indibacter alkaliphilus LW1]